MSYYRVQLVRGMLIFSSDLLDDTSVHLFRKMILSTCEKQPPTASLGEASR